MPIGDLAGQYVVLAEHAANAERNSVEQRPLPCRESTWSGELVVLVVLIDDRQLRVGDRRRATFIQHHRHGGCPRRHVVARADDKAGAKNRALPTSSIRATLLPFPAPRVAPEASLLTYQAPHP